MVYSETLIGFQDFLTVEFTVFHKRELASNKRLSYMDSQKGSSLNKWAEVLECHKQQLAIGFPEGFLHEKKWGEVLKYHKKQVATS